MQKTSQHFICIS